MNLIKRFFSSIGIREEDSIPKKNFEEDCTENGFDSGYQMIVAVSQVMSVSQQLGVTLEENIGFSEQLYEKAGKMRILNRQSSMEMEEMIDNIQTMTTELDKIKILSDSVTSASEDSGKILKGSMKEILDVVSDIDGIRESTNSMVEMMQGLKQLSGQIGMILDTVEDISKQTNLLSFNAAIESARAGAAGAGFGVVAERIRKLSLITSDSVKNISNLIENIQTSIELGNRQIDENMNKVNDSVIKFHNIEESLKQIELSFIDVVDKHKEVSDYIADQRARVHAIKDKVSVVQSSSQKALGEVEEVYMQLKNQRSSIEGLGDLGSMLNKSSEVLKTIVDNTVESVDMNETFYDNARSMLCCLKDSIKQINDHYNMNYNTCKNIIEDVLKKNSSFEAAWINDINGRFIHSIPEAGIANARVRDWFRASSDGQEYFTSPYISAITEKPCITISIPIYSRENEIIGVMGADMQC